MPGDVSMLLEGERPDDGRGKTLGEGGGGKPYTFACCFPVLFHCQEMNKKAARLPWQPRKLETYQNSLKENARVNKSNPPTLIQNSDEICEIMQPRYEQ